MHRVDDPGVGPDAEHEGKKRIRAVPSATPPGALTRFLDQRLDERLEFGVIDRVAQARRARRRGDAHACTPVTVELL